MNTLTANALTILVLALQSLHAELSTLRLSTNLDCSWTLDGKPQGRLKVNHPLTISIEPGEHKLEAVPLSGLSIPTQIIVPTGGKSSRFPGTGLRWQKVIQITAHGEIDIFIELRKLPSPTP